MIYTVAIGMNNVLRLPFPWKTGCYALTCTPLGPALPVWHTEATQASALAVTTVFIIAGLSLCPFLLYGQVKGRDQPLFIFGT